jgi:hypothetical protein
MTPDLLRAAGELLYGSRWQSDLGRALRASDRTVRRWSSGRHPVPPGVADDIIALLRDQKHSIDQFLTDHSQNRPTAAVQRRTA